MNPLAVQALYAIIRWALTLLAMRLVDHGIWGASQAETYVAASAMALITLGWSLWQKYHAALYLAIAQMLPHRSTLIEVKAIAATGINIPSAFTADTTIPIALPPPKEPV
jgi:hypothetical protein